MATRDTQQYPLNLYLINNVEDMFIILGLKVINFNDCYVFYSSSNTQVTLAKPLIKNNISGGIDNH